jgi:flagellar motor switch protein FliM
MNGNYRVIDNELARKIIHEYDVFMKETRVKIDEIRRITMFSLKKLLQLEDGDVIEIQDDGTLRIISAKGIQNG